MSRRGPRQLLFETSDGEVSASALKTSAGKVGTSGTRQRQKVVRSVKNPDMTWHDHLVMLLHIGAEIEHGLMVQYLYAAYSLGGDQVPVEHRPMVQRWRESILAVAKEEMGHLLTVQNLLTLLGAPINLDRDDMPWDVAYYPFTFRLEPLTLDSLSCYIYAEMPPESAFEKARAAAPGRRLQAQYERFEDDEKARITERARTRVNDSGALHMVGVIYGEILEILGDRERIPDSALHEDTYGVQGSWDDWGRSYRGEPRLLDAEGNRAKSDAGSMPPASGLEAQVLIDRAATRTQALDALRALSEQGEAPHLGKGDLEEPSHFDRFLEIYQEWEELGDVAWSPSLPVATNPGTTPPPGGRTDIAYIDSKHARAWAELFDLRYRVLLVYLGHTFRLARITRADTPNLRAMVMHKVFGEMYNLKTIAGILVRMPLRDGDASLNAGPPFGMPYSTALPPAEIDVWRLHRDLLGSADRRCCAMLADPKVEPRAYLESLIDLDRQTRAWIDQVIGGLAAAERHSS